MSTPDRMVYFYSNGTREATRIRRLLEAGKIPYVEFKTDDTESMIEFDEIRYSTSTSILVVINNLALDREALPAAYAD